MNYVLDTNIILVYIKDKATQAYIDQAFGPFKSENTPIISAVTVGELRALALKNNWGNRRIKIIEKLLHELVVIDIRFEDLFTAYAEIDAFSQNKHPDRPATFTARNMGKNDLWIAATTHVTSSKLLTMDKDFEHLHGEFFEVIIIEQPSQ